MNTIAQRAAFREAVRGTWSMTRDPYEHRYIFADEAVFHVCGRMRNRNFIKWSTENPYMLCLIYILNSMV
jgi:hypothetical protein